LRDVVLFCGGKVLKMFLGLGNLIKNGGEEGDFSLQNRIFI